MGSGGGGWASWRQALPAIRPQTVVLCSRRWQECTQTIGWIEMVIDSSLAHNQFWLVSCNAPTRFYRVGKKPFLKADLAIYSQAVDVYGRCMRESLILGHNLDFSSCDIMVSFHKSSDIQIPGVDYVIKAKNLEFQGGLWLSVNGQYLQQETQLVKRRWVTDSRAIYLWYK